MLQEPYSIAIGDASTFFGRGKLYRLMVDHEFTLAVPMCMSHCSPPQFRIPAGYEYDKASVPPIFWGFPLYYVPDGLCSLAALEHDFLCDIMTGGSDWLRSRVGTIPESPPAWMIHEHFRLRLHECGVKRRKAEIMGRMVAAFGPQGWAWPWLKALSIFLLILFLYLIYEQNFR